MSKYIQLILSLFLSLNFLLPAAANTCGNNQVELQILGSGGPELDDKRVSSSYLIWVNKQAKLLIDTGSGSSINFGLAGAKFEDIDAILLTHLHTDHSADLPAFIKGAFFTPRSHALKIFGPDSNNLMPSTTTFIDNLFSNNGAFRYLSDYLPADKNKPSNNDYYIDANNILLTTGKITQLKLNDDISISSTPVHHGPIAAIAWRVDIADCSITFTGDMSNNHNTLATLAKNTDILVAHNAVPETAKGIATQLHMKPSTIGVIAQQAKAKTLVLSHFMNRTQNKQTETLQQIRKNYASDVHFAEDLAKYPLTLN